MQSPDQAFGLAVRLHLPALYACGYAGVSALPAGLLSSFTLFELLREERSEAELSALLEESEGLVEMAEHLDSLALEAGIRDRLEGREPVYGSSALAALRPFLSDAEAGVLVARLEDAL